MISSDKWTCPLGTKIKLPYGTTCTTYPECGDELNINGKFYVKNENKGEGESIGIAKISDEQ